MLKRLIGLLLLLAAVIAACTPAGPAAIQVTAVTPANEAADVAVTSAVSATFNVEISQATIGRSFTLANALGPVDGTTSYDADTRTATFTPASNLAHDTEYTATLADTLRSAANGRLAAPYSWSFTTDAQPEAVTGVVVTPATETIDLGATLTLTATVTALGGADASVTWASSNEAIAQVSGAGVVTAVSEGQATITATSVFNPEASGSAVITVVDARAINSVTVSPATFELVPTGTQQLSVSVNQTGGAPTGVTWSSSDEAIATVNGSGLVTAVAPGTTTIRATSVFDPSVSGTATVEVHPALTASDYVTDAGYLAGADIDIAAPATTGGVAPLSYELTGGALPAGLTLDEDDGTIEGSTLVEGAVSGTVTVTDSLGQTATSEFSFTIAAPLVVVEYVGEDGAFGDAFGPVALITSGGLAPFTFEVVTIDPAALEWADRFGPGGVWSDHDVADQGDLPADLEVDADGNITGTVADYGFHRSYVRTTDALGQTDVTQIELGLAIGLIYDPAVYTYTTGFDGNLASGVNISVPGGSAPFTFSWARVSCSSDPCSDDVWSIDPATGEIVRDEHLTENDEDQHNGDRTYTVTVADSQTPARTATFDVSFVQVEFP